MNYSIVLIVYLDGDVITDDNYYTYFHLFSKPFVKVLAKANAASGQQRVPEPGNPSGNVLAYPPSKQPPLRESQYYQHTRNRYDHFA